MLLKDMDGPAKKSYRDEDCTPACSLPFPKDDDCFYYHGAALDRDEKVKKHDSDDGEEPVDHVGALIGPSPSTSMQIRKKERELNNSFHSQQPSEITCDDWSVDLSEFSQSKLKIKKGCDEICVEDFISLKMRVAELESQLQLQRQNVSLERKVQDLQDRKLSLECENIGLKQMLHDSVNTLKQMVQREEENATEREVAQRVQNVMQEEITNMEVEIDEIKRENQALQAQNRRLRRQRQEYFKDSLSSSGRPSTGDMESSHRGGESDDIDSATDLDSLTEVGYLPFPRQPRRDATGAKCANTAASSSLETWRAAKLPSLLGALRSHIATTSNLRSHSPGLLESSDGSRATRATADATLPSSDASQLYETWGHETWASTDEINTQTELFNRQSSARLLMKIKDNERERGGDGCVGSQSNGDAITKRHQFCRSKSEKCALTNIDAPSRTVPKRTKSFNLSRMGSSFSLVGGRRDEKVFDAENELWDTSSRDGEEEDQTVATRHSRATARF